MMRARICQVLTAVVLLALGAAGTAAAQTNTEIFEFQWNFSTPGARANGMGRAFIGVADDATAAVANPAGLLNLKRPQVYFEYKNTDLDTPRLADRDSVLTGKTTNFGETVGAVSFFSVAIPLGNRFAVSFARHQFLNYQEKFSYPPRLETDYESTGFLFSPVQGSADFQGVSYAGTIAAAIGDKLRVGLTISADQLSAESDLLRTRFTGFGLAAVDNGIKQNEAIIAHQSSTSTSMTVGALYRASDMVSAGIVFVKGPSFKVSEDFIGFDLAGKNPKSFCEVVTPCADPLFPRDLTINVPSRFGFGLSARPNSRLLVAFDVARIMYSSLAEDFVVTASFPTLKPENFTVRDTTEVHLGGEYNIIGGSNPVFIRAGLFTNPDHRLTFVPSSNLTDHEKSVSNDSFNLLPEGTKMFGTIGAGFVIGRRLQVDLAYVGSKEFVASVAGRF